MYQLFYSYPLNYPIEKVIYWNVASAIYKVPSKRSTEMVTKNQAPSSEKLQQQSFDAWVEAMELEHFKQQRELAKIAIERSRQDRRRKKNA